MSGTVREVVYLGSMTQLIVDLRTGETLTVHRLNDELAGDDVQAGSPVLLHWLAEHSYVIGNGTAGLAETPSNEGGEG